MDSANVLATQSTAILLIPQLVQFMKQSDWPMFKWITENTSGINRAISWTLGIAAAIGIHWVADCHGAACTLSVDFSQVSFAGMFHESAAVGVQLGGQQMVYKILRIADALEQFIAAQNKGVK